MIVILFYFLFRASIEMFTIVSINIKRQKVIKLKSQGKYRQARQLEREINCVFSNYLF